MKIKIIILTISVIAVLLSAAFASELELTDLTYDSELPPRQIYQMDSAGGYKLNLNTISKSMLKTIPRIGRYADEICALREELGGFESLEQLSLINGIGADTVDYAAEYLKVQ